jgi:hypothetical protein
VREYALPDRKHVVNVTDLGTPDGISTMITRQREIAGLVTCQTS